MPTELEISGGYYSGGDYASFNEWDFSGNFHPDSINLSKEAREIYNSFSHSNNKVIEKMEASSPSIFSQSALTSSPEYVSIPHNWFILLFILLVIIIIQLSCISMIVLLKTRKLN